MAPREDYRTVSACSMFRVRVLIKATGSRLHRNCGVSGVQTDSDDQLEPLKPNIMYQAVKQGLGKIEQVIARFATYNSVLIAFIILNTRTTAALFTASGLVTHMGAHRHEQKEGALFPSGNVVKCFFFIAKRSVDELFMHNYVHNLSSASGSFDPQTPHRSFIPESH